MSEEINEVSEVSKISESETLEKLDEIGVQGLDWLKDFSSKGVGFIEEQAPELCSEIIRLGIIKGIFWACFWGILCIVFAVIWRKGHVYIVSNPDKLKEEEQIACVAVAWIIPAFATIIFAMFMAQHIYTAITIWIAPRMYLLEYFTDLLSQVTGGK